MSEKLGTNLAEVSTDTISRQAAIDALNEQIEQCDKALSSFDISMKDEYAVKVERASLVAYKEQLESLQSAQPEPLKIDLSGYSEEDWERLKKEWENTPITVLSAQPKKGRWISADAMFHGVPFYCSECGENTRDTVMGKPRWKFCPMCGSRNEVTE